MIEVMAVLAVLLVTLVVLMGLLLAIAVLTIQEVTQAARETIGAFAMKDLAEVVIPDPARSKATRVKRG